MARPLISVVVIEFNMAREVPRTLVSLGRMQRDIDPDQYEIVLIDNGSTITPPETHYQNVGANVVFHRIVHASPSPAAAINVGLRLARGALIGVLIDGARLVSPGLLASARLASKISERAIISPLGFHLGREPQTSSIRNGYNQSVEDDLLTSVNWMEDGYRLFDVSVIAPGQAAGWFKPQPESTALFLSRDMWTELSGYDERFKSPGGGLVNLDTYARVCSLPNIQPIMLLGEGTFHQIHGGVASNAVEHPWPIFHEEYKRIRGGPFKAPQYNPLCFGKVRSNALLSVAQSAQP